MHCGIERLYRKISDHLISGFIDPMQVYYMNFVCNFMRISGSYSGGFPEFCLLRYRV
jgi:hypothetical protein